MTTKIPFQLLADGTAGQMITYDASGVIALVATGTAGQLLASNGAGAAPTMQTFTFITPSSSDTLTNKTIDADGTGNVITNIDIGNCIAASQAEAEAGTDNTKMVTSLRVAEAIAALDGGGIVELLDSQTASASSTLDYVSLITSSHDRYFLVIIDLLNSAAANVLFLGSDSNGSPFDNNIQSQRTKHQLGGTTATVLTGENVITGVSLTDANNSTYNGIIEIINPLRAGNSKPNIFSSLNQPNVLVYETRIGPFQILNAFQLKPSSGNFTSGGTLFYGVKNT